MGTIKGRDRQPGTDGAVFFVNGLTGELSNLSPEFSSPEFSKALNVDKQWD
jgi:hypothetical protein